MFVENRYFILYGFGANPQKLYTLWFFTLYGLRAKRQKRLVFAVLYGFTIHLHRCYFTVFRSMIAVAIKNPIPK